VTLALLDLKNVYKAYHETETPVESLRGGNLTLEAGEFFALMGPSGCGKSTLLHLCGAMDRPSSGSVEIEGVSVSELEEETLTRFRRTRIGFVFQFFNLLPTLRVVENIALPLLLSGVDPNEADRSATAIAGRVGLGHRLRHYPRQLSGGEMQRAALARGVIHRPALLIADEPTGNLDSGNGALVLQLLADLNRETGVTLLLATHDPSIAAGAERVCRMRDGCIETGDRSRHPVAGE